MAKCKCCLDYHESDRENISEYTEKAENTKHQPFNWGVEVGIFRDSVVPGRMYVDLLMNGANITISDFDINYCPMCGRKLKEDK